jgi:hypothetical protein
MRSRSQGVSGAIGATLLVAGALPAALTLSSCEDAPPPPYSYYDDRIDPIVRIGCAQQTTGCHLPSPEGTAAGNLDLSSFDSLMRRRDALPAYGPYPVGLLLMKVTEPKTIRVETFDAPPGAASPDDRFVTITTDVRHAAGSGVRLDSRGYAELQRWIQAGHTRTGVPPAIEVASSEGCRNAIGIDSGFDASVPPADTAGYEAFKRDVQPVLRNRCAGGACHASPIADLYLACGDTEEELRWNFHIAERHLASPVSTSELLRRPLAQIAGGTFHEGGDVFADTSDGDYRRMVAWAEDVVARNPAIGSTADAGPGLRFFANRVQPMLVKKGCMFLNCHSPSMFHDLRLRGGSQGIFSRVATERNYEKSRAMLSLESLDVNASRFVAKNLFPPAQVPGGQGIPHRGGALFEDFGTESRPNPATPDDCAGFDADAGPLDEIPAYCVIARWHAIERAEAVRRGEVRDAAAPLGGVVYVSRPADVGRPEDFDTYRPGADLILADATLGADGSVTLGAERSVLAGCGLTAASADVRGPAVSWDGRRIAFSARTSAATSHRLYWMNADGSGCERVPDVSPPADVDPATGIALHDFDPAFAPDGRLVFASTRGNVDCAEGLEPCGPSRTPAALTPNANLFVYEPGAASRVRQLTFLLNQELQPAFMVDGRAIFTTEKREPDFHQFAGRRINLDGGDYHPLLAQRGQRLGFERATEINELSNRNFVFVASALAATHGAGAIVVMNRSIGPDQIDRPATDRAYIAAFRALAGGGPIGRGGSGAFRSPAPLPGNRMIVSCDLGAGSHEQPSYDFDLCELDGASGAVRRIGGRPGTAEIEAVAIYGRTQLGVFTSRPDEANGHTSVDPAARDAVVHVQDFVMLETLLFTNTREGRPIDPNVGGFDVLVAKAPPPSARSFAEAGPNVVTDAYGPMYREYEFAGNVPLYADGSAKFRYRGGLPVLLRVTDRNGNPLQFGPGMPFSGERIQREQMQFYPGERSNQGFQRRFFNAMCGGCHGSVSGRELDIGVDVDVLTSASVSTARDRAPVDLR